MKIILYSFIILFLLGCKTLVDPDNISSKVYYFEQEDLTSIEMIDCTDLISEKTLGLRMIDSLPSALVRKFQISVAESSKSGSIPDIRYRVELDNQIICIDYNGKFVTNENIYGKINFLEDLEDYIRKNSDSSVLIGKSTELPPIN